MSDYTFSVTVGKWGGFSAGHYKHLGIRRLCLGFVAFSLLRGDLIAIQERTLEALGIGPQKEES